MSAPRTHDTRRMHDNSIATYREEVAAERLSKRESEVIEILERIGQGTDREILAASRYSERNSIQPRISELVERGVLEEFDNIRDETTGKTVRVVRIANGVLRNPIAGARHAARLPELSVRPEATPPVTTARCSDPVPAICARCAGAGVIRVDQNPDRYEWCDYAAGETCDAAEKLRATNPSEVEQSNSAALKTFKLSSPAPGVLER